MNKYFVYICYLKLIYSVFIGKKNQQLGLHQHARADVENIEKFKRKNNKEIKKTEDYVKQLEDEIIMVERMNERMQMRLKGIN